jgi:hypothetical protein
MNAVQQKEVVALVTWLQTFPEFVVCADNSDPHQHQHPQQAKAKAIKLIADGQTHVAVEALVAELDTWSVVRYVTSLCSVVVLLGCIIVEGSADHRRYSSHRALPGPLIESIHLISSLVLFLPLLPCLHHYHHHHTIERLKR